VAATVLTSCDRPLPAVSVLSGSTLVRVTPQTYFFNGPASARVTSGTVKSISATGGKTLLVDVPREVADQQWQVTAVTIDAQGKQSSVNVDGASSPVVTDSHSTRVVVPYATGSYYLKVLSGRGKSGGVWLVQVNVA